MPSGNDKKSPTKHKFVSCLSATCQLEAMEKEKRIYANRVKATCLKSENPLLRLMQSSPTMADYSAVSMSLAGMSSMKPIEYPNLVNDERGKHFLSKGIVPSNPPMRYDVVNLMSNWSNIEHKHEVLRRELDSVDLELQRREADLKLKILASTMNSSKGFSRFANNSVIKPGSNVCGSGFAWSGAFSNTYKEDFVKHEKLADPLTEQYKKLHTEYGEYTKTCDLPEPNIYINPNAPKKLKGRTTASSNRF